MTKEILRQEASQAGPRGTGGEKNAKRRESTDYETQFNQITPTRAYGSDYFSCQSKREQKDAAADQSGRMENNGAGDMDIDRPVPVPCRRNSDQRRCDDQSDGTPIPKDQRQALVKQSVSVDEDSVGEHAAHPKAQQLNMPARFRWRIAKEVFYQQDTVN